MKPGAVVLAACLVASVAAQSVTVSTNGGTLRVRAPEFAFIEGELLNRLRDGRSVRVDLALHVLSEPRGAAVAETQQSFNLSFDLWEERVAVTRVGTSSRSVSHLQPRDAEAWCLENLTLSRAALGQIGAGTPFWIRLTYGVPEPAPTADSESDETFTLRRLIDVLSRRPRGGELGKSIEAGPFRLSN